MIENKTIRLNRVLRELNISLDKAVNILSLNGHNINPRPTTKITEEQKEILNKEIIDSDKRIKTYNNTYLKIDYEGLNESVRKLSNVFKVDEEQLKKSLQDNLKSTISKRQWPSYRSIGF